MVYESFPDPALMGLPEKFSSWRPFQESVVADILRSGPPFRALQVPTGFGKSLCYIAAGKLYGSGRVVILTSTKALQDQLVGDFGPAGLVALKGRNAYPCTYSPGLSAAECPARLFKFKCPCLDACPHHQAVQSAIKSPLVVMNYALWVRLNTNTMEDNPFADPGLLVMDEAHDAPFHVFAARSGEVVDSELRSLLRLSLPAYADNSPKWEPWARHAITRIIGKQNRLLKRAAAGDHAELRTVSLLSNLKDRLELLTISPDNAVLYARSPEPKEDRVVFGLVELDYARDVYPLIIAGAKRTVFISATVVPKTLELLKLPSDAVQFQSYPSLFHHSRCPVTWVQTILVSRKTPDAQIVGKWVPQLDRVIASRTKAGHKGIIHTHSYSLARTLLAQSRHREVIYHHGPYNRDSVIQMFKSATSACVLVSPSVSTGHDFPYDQCRFQVISKMPFPSFGDRLLVARSAQNPGLIDYLTAQQLVQCSGRGMRAEDDECETLVIDDNFGWWYAKNKTLLPKWFTSRVHQVKTIPPLK